MIGALFLCWISTRNAFSQNVAWTVGTSVPTFMEDLRLDCTVDSNCCTTHNRIWETGTGTQILNNGTSSLPNKYVEEWNGATSGFSLIIKNLQLSDVGVDYNCRYRLGSDKHILNQNDTWEYTPTEQCESYAAFEKKKNFIHYIARSAPVPSVIALIEGKNVTSGLTKTGPTNFDTWFYSLKVFIDLEVYCKENENARLTLKVVTGTKTTTVCEKRYLCYPCLKCAGLCFAWALLGLVGGCFLTWLCYFIGFSCFNSYWSTRNFFGIKYEVKTDENCSKLYGKSYRKVNRNRALLISSVTTVSGYITIYCVICAFFLFGSNCPSCKGLTDLRALSFGFGVLIFLAVLYVALNIFDDDTCTFKQFRFFAGLVLFLLVVIPMPIMIFIHFVWWKGDDTHRWEKVLRRFCEVVGCIALLPLFPIIILVFYFVYLKGGNNRSTESGSSCWPPCQVGQDPITPDPENARSLLKKKADKKNEEKPVAVVRSQPKNRHVKTDNTESTKFSAENETFSGGLDKGRTSRPLPSIGQPTNSPRPLPEMPPGTQQEKGGFKLEPLQVEGDSSPKKKKTKKRKKKETKQSDKENSTDF